MGEGLFAREDRNIDIVFCLDITGDNSKLLEFFNENIEDLTFRLRDYFVDHIRIQLGRLRFKFIFFKDFAWDPDPLKVTKFFRVPDHLEELKAIMKTMDAQGGGDTPESGLEALYLAMTSKWSQGIRDRQIIMLFTNSEAKDGCNDYTYDGIDYPFPGLCFESLKKIWDEGSEATQYLPQRTKRLIVYAPSGTLYDQINEWERTVHYDVDPENEFASLDVDTIIHDIKNALV